MDDAGAQLHAERDRVRDRLASLRAEHAGVVAAAAGSNLDDEHDPEGATVGYERELLRAGMDRAAARLAELDEAVERLRTGRYGECEACGGPVGAERLAARPAAIRCVACASR